MEEASRLNSPGSRVRAELTSYGDCERDGIGCISCGRNVFVAGGPRQKRHFRHFPRLPHEMHMPPVAVCIARVAQDIARRKGLPEPSITLPRGQELQKYFDNFEAETIRLQGHGERVTILLDSMRERPSYRAAVLRCRSLVETVVLKGATADNGEWVPPLIDNSTMESDEGHEPGYAAAFNAGLEQTLKFTCNAASEQPFLFSVTLGLAALLWHGLRDARYGVAPGKIDLASHVDDARIADFVMFNNDEFRAFIRGSHRFYSNSTVIFANAVLHTSTQFVTALIAEHCSQEPA